jgi:uncharacterized membrane protein (UPF0127 family)
VLPFRRLHAAAFVPLSLYGATAGNWPANVHLRIGHDGCLQGSDFIAEVAQTRDEQTRGLGGRAQQLAPDRAMIFVMKQTEPASFWMKDALIPLTLLYFGPDSRLLDAMEMPVESDPAHPSRSYPESRPVLAAIEIAGGSSGRFAQDAVLCVLLGEP